MLNDTKKKKQFYYVRHSSGFISIRKKKREPTYWERVVYGKGTVAEPWPTAKELWNDPEVKEAIDTHNKSVAKRNGSQK